MSGLYYINHLKKHKAVLYLVSEDRNGVRPLKLSLGGGHGIFTDRNQREYFWGFEFRTSVFFWLLLTSALFFGLLDKCCIFKCFIFLTVFFGSCFIHLILQ